MFMKNITTCIQALDKYKDALMSYPYKIPFPTVVSPSERRCFPFLVRRVCGLRLGLSCAVVPECPDLGLGDLQPMMCFLSLGLALICI